MRAALLGGHYAFVAPPLRLDLPIGGAGEGRGVFRVGARREVVALALVGLIVFVLDVGRWACSVLLSCCSLRAQTLESQDVRSSPRELCLLLDGQIVLDDLRRALLAEGVRRAVESQPSLPRHNKHTHQPQSSF